MTTLQTASQQDTRTAEKPYAGPIREWDYPLVPGSAMSPEVTASICAKSMMRYRDFYRYWLPAQQKGVKAYKNTVGEIFTNAEKEEFRRQDKIVISSPELIPKINALEGMQINSRRTGTIIPVGGEDAPSAELIEHLLREDIQRKNNVSEEVTACFTDGIVTGYPQFMWFDKAASDDRDKKLDVHHDSWDASLPDPKFTRRNLSDAEEIIRVRTLTRQQMLMYYPERAEEINRLMPEGTSWDSLSLNASFVSTSSSDRDEIIQRMNTLMSMYATSGLIYTVERLYFVMRPTTVYVFPGQESVTTLPPEWTPAEAQAWKQQNPTAQAIKKNVRVLWVTTCTPFNLLLENRPHWFQEGEFPGEAYIPRKLNNKFYGIAEFVLGALKGRSVAKIEQLHSLRLANDQLMIVRDGALVNPASAAVEKARVGGILVVSRFANMEDVKFPANSRENLGWADMTETFLADMDRLSVDRNFEGGSQSSQESGELVKTRIAQMQMKHMPYISSISDFNLRVARKCLMMIPVLWTEEEIFRYVDPKKVEEGVKTEILNEPIEFDWSGSGTVTRVKNNLQGAKYDYVEAEGDNSPTAKEHEMLVFQDILDHLAQIKDVSLWPSLLASVPNHIAQQFGKLLDKKIQDSAKAAAENPPPAPAKAQVNIDGKTLPLDIVVDILRKMGVLDKFVPPMPGQPGMPVNAGEGAPPGGPVAPAMPAAPPPVPAPPQ